jgi:hypothetical protein
MYTVTERVGYPDVCSESEDAENDDAKDKDLSV